MLSLILTLTNFSYAVGEGGPSATLPKDATSVSAKDVGEFLDSPQGVLLMSGIATVYSGMLYKAAAQQEDDSNANIKKIDQIIATFKDSFIAYCPNGRDDLAKPDCYCYLENGKQNTDRTKSQTCQALWAKNNYKNLAAAGNYGGTPKAVDPSGCLTSDGKFDENCQCKKFVDAKGVNSCMKMSSINIPSDIAPSLAAGGLKDVMQLGNNTGNGNPMFNTFKPNSLGTKAVALNNLKNQLLQKYASLDGEQGNKGNLILNEKNVGQFARSAFGDSAIASAIANSKSPLSIGSSLPTDPKSAALLKAAAIKSGVDLVGSGTGLQNKKTDKKEAFTLSVGNDANGAGVGQVQNYPETEKTYKVNDISNQSSTSLFEIISNRYIQSGLKRLFEQ